MKSIEFTHKEYKGDFSAYLYANKSNMHKGAKSHFPCSKDQKYDNKEVAFAQFCTCKGLKVGLFFCKDEFNAGIVAHEVTHMMLRLVADVIGKGRCRYDLKIKNSRHEESICADIEQIVNHICNDFLK